MLCKAELGRMYTKQDFSSSITANLLEIKRSAGEHYDAVIRYIDLLSQVVANLEETTSAKPHCNDNARDDADDLFDFCGEPSSNSDGRPSTDSKTTGMDVSIGLNHFDEDNECRALTSESIQEICTNQCASQGHSLSVASAPPNIATEKTYLGRKLNQIPRQKTKQNGRSAAMESMKEQDGLPGMPAHAQEHSNSWHACTKSASSAASTVKQNRTNKAPLSFIPQTCLSPVCTLEMQDGSCNLLAEPLFETNNRRSRSKSCTISNLDDLEAMQSKRLFAKMGLGQPRSCTSSKHAESNKVSDIPEDDPPSPKAAMEKRKWRLPFLSASTSSPCRSPSGLDELRAARESVLVQTADFANVVTTTATDKDMKEVRRGKSTRCRYLRLLHRAPEFVLRLTGVIPWCTGIAAMCYCSCVGLVLVCELGYVLQVTLYQDQILNQHLLMACYSCGCLLAFISVHASGIQDILGPEIALLEKYATSMSFQDEWHKRSFYRFLVIMLLGGYVMFTRLMAYQHHSCREFALQGVGNHEEHLQLMSFMIVTCILLALMLTHVHICCAMELSVDKFCLRLWAQKDLIHGTVDWNMVTAMLRRSAHAVDTSFIVLSTSILSTLVLAGVELVLGGTSISFSDHCHPLWHGWVLPSVLLMLYMSYCSAMVTEKCSRVPALINSWAADHEGFEYETQYAVQYVSHSAAGFYVKGVRLTAFMTLKVTYLLGVIGLTLVTRTALAS